METLYKVTMTLGAIIGFGGMGLMFLMCVLGGMGYLK